MERLQGRRRTYLTPSSVLVVRTNESECGCSPFNLQLSFKRSTRKDFPTTFCVTDFVFIVTFSSCDAESLCKKERRIC